MAVSDAGTGWLVAKNGTWFPVAYNASVNEELGYKRVAFEGLNGTRTVAGTGVMPRQWTLEETVPLDWAQELHTLYLTSGADNEFYFIPPLAAGTNYAPFLPLRTKRDPYKREDGMTGWQVTSPTGIDTDLFPVREGMRIEYGGYQDGGSILLRLFKNDMLTGAGTTSVAAKSLIEEASKTVTITAPGAAWARMESSGVVSATRDRFVRMPDLSVGFSRKYGMGGQWVTLENMSLEHGAVSKTSPLVKVSMDLKEVLRS